jgi:hypothetical protein
MSIQHANTTDSLFQSTLTDVNHPDHTLITYPNLGHIFYPSSQWARVVDSLNRYLHLFVGHVRRSNIRE